ncbi:MAG: energy-coupling factor ABC transporter ATP-binding protein [Candidatus Saccharibacteria bacterium]
MGVCTLPDKLFELKDASFEYVRGEPLFDKVNLEINVGDKVCLLGANGSGKSTLLKILSGLIFPTAGIFNAFGEEITEDMMEDDHNSQEYHRRVGYIFQNSDAQLFTTRVWDEVAFGPLQLGLTPAEVKMRVDDILKMLNIDHLREKSPYRLSGGEKKKVAMATVLVFNPNVLILDEPTNGLDPKTQRWLVEVLLELNKHGRTIITATHNLELAHDIADRAIVLSESHEIVYDGPANEAINDSRLLLSVNLIDEYYHVHDMRGHIHRRSHG